MSEKIPVKVALVLGHLPHYRYGLFRELEQKAELVTFVAGQGSKDGSIASVPTDMLARVSKVRNLWFGPFLWQSGVASRLGKLRPDSVVFTGDPRILSNWINAALSRLRGQKVFFWTIGWHRPDQGVRRLVRLAFYSLADELLLYGNYGRELGISSGYPADRMNVVYNSIESLTDSADEAIDSEKFPDGTRPVIGAVVRLSTNKGLDEIIKSAALLKTDYGISADCLVVGEGPARHGLEKLATQLGVKLYLPGALYSLDRLKDVYKKLTVTVIPKAAGLTVLQSLEAGTPVVTISDPYQQGPEFEAIQDGVTGSLIDNADGNAIASACSVWIQRLSEDSGETAKECRLSVREKWSPETQASRILDAVKRLKPE